MTQIIAHLLLRNKQVKTLRVNPKSDTFQFLTGLYVISPDLIRLNTENNAELFYFENNPTPINVGNSDKSSYYLNEFIKTNFIQQINEKMSGSNPFGFLNVFKNNPQLIVGIVLGLIVVYAVITGGFKP